ncbi:hypothetical protein GCM10027578_13620 [Spirosoma luteolum]
MTIRSATAALGAVLLLMGCASSRPVGSSRSSVDYSAYEEDLSSVRPVYGAGTTGRAGTSSRPASVSTTTVPTATTPARKPDVRRPAAGPVSALHVNRQLDQFLDTLAQQNRSIRYAPGFRIQVYVGTQRQEVESIKLLIYQNFPELNPYLSYNQPTYKLKVGDFMRRTDAERYFASIRQLIRSAQLQGDKVDIRRSLSIK